MIVINWGKSYKSEIKTARAREISSRSLQILIRPVSWRKDRPTEESRVENAPSRGQPTSSICLIYSIPVSNGSVGVWCHSISEDSFELLLYSVMDHSFDSITAYIRHWTESVDRANGLTLVGVRWRHQVGEKGERGSGIQVWEDLAPVYAVLGSWSEVETSPIRDMLR